MELFSFEETVVSGVAAITGADTPDIAIPAANNNAATFVFFIKNSLTFLRFLLYNQYARQKIVFCTFYTTRLEYSIHFSL